MRPCVPEQFPPSVLLASLQEPAEPYVPLPSPSPAKSEPSSQEDAISQLAREIETVANSLLNVEHLQPIDPAVESNENIDTTQADNVIDVDVKPPTSCLASSSARYSMLGMSHLPLPDNRLFDESSSSELMYVLGFYPHFILLSLMFKKTIIG